MAQAPVRSFTVLAVAAIAAAISALWPTVDLDDRMLPSDRAAASGAVERRADYGRGQPCVVVAPQAQAHEPEASAAEASSCL
jgi:hypothetical protein